MSLYGLVQAFKIVHNVLAPWHLHGSISMHLASRTTHDRLQKIIQHVSPVALVYSF